MRRSSRLLVVLALSLGLAPASACKRTGSSDTSPGSSGATEDARPKRARRKPGMPRPLRLSASAPVIVHVQAPGDTLAGLRAYLPELPVPHTLLAQLAAQVPGAGDLEVKLAHAVDLERSWDAASVDGELVVHLPIAARQLDTVATLLADKPPVGRFGAVDLQRSAGPLPRLAWLDREAKTLTLASSERGLATGPTLARYYGKDHPLRLRLQGAETRKYAPEFALEQLEVQGQGTHQLELTAQGVPPEFFPTQIEAGALSGLLESPRIAVGASSRYTHHDRDVRKILGDIKRQVDRQNFLVKPTLQDLHRRLGSVMRSWDGRTMVGVGPKNHVLVGMGADDPKKMGGALFHLTTGVIDNLSLARSLGVSVPRVRFKRNKNAAAGSNISVIALEGARKYLPPDAAGLVDDKGDLRIAVAFPSRAGAGLAVIGPDCHTVMARWLEDIADATPAKDSTQDYLAAILAVDATQFEPLLGGGRGPTAFLDLEATRDPTRVTVVRKDDTVTLKVTGPEVGFRPRRTGFRGPVSRATPGPTPGPTPGGIGSAGKPARTPPARTKPLR